MNTYDAVTSLDLLTYSDSSAVDSSYLSDTFCKNDILQ